MATLLLHIDKHDRREALARALEDDHEVLRGPRTGAAERQEDLLILDYATLNRNGPHTLSSYRMDDPRPESPILLLVPPPQSGNLTQTTWTTVDEVVEIPVRWPEMRNRIQVLLRMQEHAQESEQFRELAAKYKVMLETQQGQLTGYKTLFRNGGCGTLVVDELEIVEANSPAERLFNTDDLVGASLGSLLPPLPPEEEGAEANARELIDLVEDADIRVESEFLRAGDETFSASLLLRPLQFGGAECIQILFLDKHNGTASIESATARKR